MIFYKEMNNPPCKNMQNSLREKYIGCIVSKDRFVINLGIQIC